jgi:hypothetical protein
MKVKFTIQKGKETVKTGLVSSKEVDKYTLMATFTPSELEKKIFNDHPLFKDVLFMQYNELDRFATGFLNLGAQQAVDQNKAIYVGHIYGSPTFQFRAYSVSRIIELRKIILDAGEIFAHNVKILEGLIGSEEIEFKSLD